MATKALKKDERHICYYVQDEWLMEAYNTIRGVRNRVIINVPGHPNAAMINDTFAKNLYNDNISERNRLNQAV